MKLPKPGVQPETPEHPIPYAEPGIGPEAPGHPIPYAEPGVQPEAQQPKQQEQSSPSLKLRRSKQKCMKGH